MRVKRKTRTEENPVVPVLTRPQGVTGGSDVPKAILPGFKRIVNALISLRQAKEALETKEAQLRAPLQKAACAARAQLENLTGKTIKSVITSGTQRDIRFTWRNVYQTVNLAHEAALRKCLGDHFDTLFVRTRRLTLCDDSPEGRDVVVSELRDALGPRFDNLFNVTTEIAARDTFMERCTEIRPQLSAQQNTALDLVLEQIQADPAMAVR